MISKSAAARQYRRPSRCGLSRCDGKPNSTTQRAGRNRAEPSAGQKAHEVCAGSALSPPADCYTTSAQLPIRARTTKVSRPIIVGRHVGPSTEPTGKMRFAGYSLVGETGFEPATARPPAGCATRLRHSPWSRHSKTRTQDRSRPARHLTANSILRPPNRRSTVNWPGLAGRELSAVGGS